MENEEKDGFLYSNENTVIRIATTAVITSWVILLIYAVSFVMSIFPLLNGSVPLSQVVDQPSSILNIIYPLVMGVVYFCILQGIVRLLHLGLDIYYALRPEKMEEEEKK